MKLSSPEPEIPAADHHSFDLSRISPVPILLIIAIAAAFRLAYVTMPLTDAFSWRQASTAMMADNYYLTSWNIFFPEVSWTGPGPGYQGREFQVLSYLTALLYAVFGWHDWIGRAVALVFGLITIVSLYALVAEVWDRAHALAAAFVYAVLPIAVTVDTSVLPDSAMLALTTLSVYLFVRYFNKGRGVAPLVGATAIFAVGVLAKLPGLVAGPVLLQLMVAKFILGDKRAGLAIGFAVIASMIPIVAYYLWAIYLGTNYPPYHVAGSGFLWDRELSFFIENRFYIDSLLQVSEWWLYGKVGMGLFLLGLWALLPDANPRFLRLVPFVWLASFVFFYLVASEEIVKNPWNMHMLSVPFAIFAGRGVIVLTELGKQSLNPWFKSGRLVAICAFLVMFTSLPLVTILKEPIAENGRLLGQKLEELSRPGELVVAVSPDVGDPVAIYYSRRRGWVFPAGGGERVWSVFHDTDAEALAELETMRLQGAKWFGVTKNARDDYDRLFIEHHAGLLSHLNRTMQPVAETDEYIIYQLTGPLPLGPSGG